MSNTKVMCMCGEVYGVTCKLSQMGSPAYILDTSKLTDDPEENLNIAMSGKYSYRDTRQHGPLKNEDTLGDAVIIKKE